MEAVNSHETSINGGPRGGGDNEALSLIGLATGALRNRYLLVFLPLAFAIVALIISLRSPRNYQAEALIVPQATNQARSPLVGVAAQLGVTIPAAQGAMTPAFYAQLMKTRDILTEVVRTSFEFEAGGEQRRGDLVTLYGLQPEEGVTPDVPPADVALEMLRGSINTSVAYETGIVTLKASAPYPRLSELIAARVLELTQEFDLGKRQSQAAAERRFAEERAREKAAELNTAEEALKAFLTANRLFQNSPELLLEHARLERAVVSRQQVFTAVSQAYEQARIDEVRNTPVITVIASPQGTARPLSRGTVRRVLVALILGAALAVALASVRESVRRSRRSDLDRYEEFTALKHETLRDLRLVRTRVATSASDLGG